MFACPATDDFFRSRIDQMIDLRHPLAVLASRMPWQQIEGLHVVSCGKQHRHWGIAGANGLAGRCLSLDMRR